MSGSRRLPLVPFLICVFAMGLAPGAPVAAEKTRQDRGAEGRSAPERRRPIGPLPGKLLLYGGSATPAAMVDLFVSQAGGEKARIVLITAARDRARGTGALFSRRKVASLRFIHSTSLDQSRKKNFFKPLEKATGVWIAGDDPSALADAYAESELTLHLLTVLNHGGIVGSQHAGSAILGERFLPGKGRARSGLGLLAGFMIVPRIERKGLAGRVAESLARNPGLVGCGLTGGTLMLIWGRRAAVIGNRPATLFLAPSKGRPARSDRRGPGDPIDLIAMSRAAIARADSPFPTKNPPVPNVPKGTLVISGGGLTRGILSAFIKAAGGPEKARLVIIPTALGEPQAGSKDHGRFWRGLGMRHVKVVHARNRKEADDPKNLAALREATGIWFTGGRKWRLVDSFLDTRAHLLMREVLKRGGVIGGGSAGATIQADYLVRGNPLGNQDMMAEGYERGLGFIRGVAIDQHFAQRNRFQDMARVKKTFPQLIGLGIDEETALIVRGSVAEVVGKHRVYVYDQRSLPSDGKVTHTMLTAGQRYDFKARRIAE